MRSDPLEEVVHRLAHQGGQFFPGSGEFEPHYERVSGYERIAAYSHHEHTLVLDARPTTKELSDILGAVGPIREAVFIPRADKALQRSVTQRRPPELSDLDPAGVAAATPESYLRAEHRPRKHDEHGREIIRPQAGFVPYRMPPVLAIPEHIRLRKAERTILNRITTRGGDAELSWYLSPERGFSADGILTARLERVEREYTPSAERQERGAPARERYVTEEVRRLADPWFTTHGGGRFELSHGFEPIYVPMHKTS